MVSKDLSGSEHMVDSGRVAGRRGDRNSPSQLSERQGRESQGQGVSSGWSVHHVLAGRILRESAPERSLCVCQQHTRTNGVPHPEMRRAGQEGENRDSLCPLSLVKTKPEHWAGGRPAGRQTGLAKLPVTSQKFQGPLGVAPPQLAPLQAGCPRQQVLPAPSPFHPVTIEQAKGRGHADPRPDAWRSI